MTSTEPPPDEGVREPAEADELIAACDKHGAKIAVAHRNRYHPALKQIDQLLESGQLGRLLEIRGRGKGDRRGGGEDLEVVRHAVAMGRERQAVLPR